MVKGFETLRESSHFLRKSREPRKLGGNSLDNEANHSQRLFIPAEAMGEINLSMSEEEKKQHIAKAMKKLSHSTLKGMILSMSREFNQESSSFNSPVVHLEDFLSKANSQSQHLATPNLFSTVTAMQSLDILANSLPSYGQLLGSVRDTLLKAVFYNYDDMKVVIDKIERKQRRLSPRAETGGEEIEEKRLKTSFAELVPFHEVLKERDDQIQRLKMKIEKLEHFGRRKAQLELQFAKLLGANSKEKEMKLLKRIIDGWRMQVRPSVNCVINFANHTCNQRLKRKGWEAIRSSLKDSKQSNYEQERLELKTKIMDQSKQVQIHTKRTAAQSDQIDSLKIKVAEKSDEISSLQGKLRIITTSMGNYNPATIRGSVGYLLESLMSSKLFKLLPRNITWENQSLVPLLQANKTVGERPYHEQIRMIDDWNLKKFLLRWVNYCATEGYRKIKQEIRGRRSSSIEKGSNSIVALLSTDEIQQLQRLALRQVAHFMLALYHQNQQADLVQDVLKIANQAKQRRKCEHLATLMTKFTGVGNICSVLHLVQKDPKHICSQLAYLFLQKPALPIPDSKHVEVASVQILKKINLELRGVQSIFLKMQVLPHLTALYSNPADANKDSVTDFILRWVNNVAIGGEATKESERIRSFQDLNANNYDLAAKLIRKLESLSDFNTKTKIGGLATYNPKKRAKKQETQEWIQQQEDMVCIEIVNAVTGITGRQDLIFLHQLAAKPRVQISWEPILIELFLNRPLIFPKGFDETRQERAIQLLQENQEIMQEYWGADVWGRPLIQLEKTIRRMVEALELFASIDKEFALLQRRLRKRRDYVLKQEIKSDFIRERLVFTSHVSVAAHPRMLVADQVFLLYFRDMTVLEPVLHEEIAAMLLEYSGPITTLLSFYLGEKNYFSYLDIWSLMKSIEIDRHGVDVVKIESHFLSDKAPARGVDRYTFRLGIEDFWKFVLTLAFDLFDEQLNREISLDPDQQRSLHAFTLRRFLSHSLLKERCSSFEHFRSHPFRHHLLTPNIQSYIMKDRIDALVGLYDYYGQGEGCLSGEQLEKMLKISGIVDHPLLGEHVHIIITECLQVSFKKQALDTEQSEFSIQEEEAKYEKGLMQSKMVFYDFVECIFNISQFGWAHLSVEERFQYFMERELIPPLLKDVQPIDDEDPLRLRLLQVLPRHSTRPKLKRRPTLI